MFSIMAFRDWGNPPILSTHAPETDPSTDTIVAEVTGLQNRLYEVRYCVGASTGAIWRLEHALSSGLGSTGYRDQVVVFTGSNQTAEYVMTYKAEANDRFRVVPLSSGTGTFAAKIQAEVLT